jgi:hypothetical protein
VLAVFGWPLLVVPIVGTLAGFLALRRIRKNPAGMTGEHLALAGVMLSVLFLVGGSARLTIAYRNEVPDGYVRISYDDLKPEPVKKGEQEVLPPPRASELNGKKVFIKGYVYQPPGSQVTGLKQFVLVRDKGDCCFGGNPKITDMIQVRMLGDLKAKFDMRVIRLAGTFRVARSLGMHGLPGAIYLLDADHVQ